VEPLVRALALLPAQATLDVVGPPEPAYVPTISSIIDELGLAERVHMSEVPREQLRSIYADADVFVFPSLWAEPFGLVPIEAMACDTPVVASGTGGSAEFLRDGANCLIAPPRQPAAIADAINRLSADPGLRRRLLDGGRTTAAWADVNQLTETVAAWHDHAAGGFSGAAPPDRRPPQL
jgi:glycosyltransferase involved in cell wall biosynthesis